MEAVWGRIEVVGKCSVDEGCGLRAIPAGQRGRGDGWRHREPPDPEPRAGPALAPRSPLCTAMTGRWCCVKLLSRGEESWGDGLLKGDLSISVFFTVGEMPGGDKGRCYGLHAPRVSSLGVLGSFGGHPGEGVRVQEGCMGVRAPGGVRVGVHQHVGVRHWVCTGICMHVCAHTCAGGCAHAAAPVCTCVQCAFGCLYACMCVSACASAVCTAVHGCACTCTQIRMRVHECVCVCTRVQACVHVLQHECARICVHSCAIVCRCVQRCAHRPAGV